MKKIFIILTNIFFITSLFFSGLLFLSKIQNFPFPKIFLVSSGSMEPAIKTGSLVFTSTQKNYSVGDIITFKTDTKSKVTTTHRIVANSGNVIKTAGDANTSPDPKLIKVENVVGKVFYILPYLGYLASFIQTPQGFILFVIVPATILVYEEFKSLLLEIKNYFIKKNKIPSPQLWRGVGVRLNFLKGFLVIIPIFFAGLIITTKSNSYFSDIETSSSNTFTAWIPTATPIPPTPTTPPSPTPTPSPANHIVFSEIQIKGSNANQDFIEFYNPTSSSQDLSGWKIRVCTSSGSESSLALIPSGKSIPGYGYFLWASNKDTGFDTSVGADISNGNTITENYSLALKKPDDSIVDQIGWGTNNCSYYENVRYPDINNSIKSVERKAYWNSNPSDMILGGIHETKGNSYDGNNNSTDFISRSTGSNPQNSLSSPEIP